MTATDELRRMLDERGAEYRVSATGYSIDIGPYITAYANRSDTTLDVSLRNVTPEQAVDATLGRGTCRLEREPDSDRLWWCSNCQSYHEHVSEFPWEYCPRCGAKVVR